MTLASSSPAHDAVAEVLARLEDETPGLVLLRFIHARTPAWLAARLRGRADGPRCVELAYQAGAAESESGSVARVVQEAVREAATPPPPVIFLVPNYGPTGLLVPHRAEELWKRLNGQREVLGNLAARVVLCLDPEHEPYALAHARDLLSWCAPKFLLTPSSSSEPAGRDREIRSESQPREGVDDAAHLRGAALGALWRRITATGEPLTSAHVEGVGLPLMAALLEDGRVAEADHVAAVASSMDLPAGRTRAALELMRGDLAMLQGRFEQASPLYESALGAYEQALAANPESGQAARDVSVSLDRLGDFLASRGQAGDAEKALGYYERSLKVAEDLWTANPESGQAARDVSVSLNKLGDFLASRGQAGDAEKALGYYERSLKVAEELWTANPESAAARRDLLVSLERMARAEAGRVGRENAALELQSRSLKLALELREQNPGSWFYQRTAAVSFLLTSQRAQAAGQGEQAAQCLAGCLGLLHEAIAAGVEVDSPMRQLYEQLKGTFPGTPKP